MRYVRIFLLNFQRTLRYRSLSFVWFLCALVDVGIIIFFWNGATSGKTIGGWNFSELLTYYLFALTAGQLLISHIEYDVATLHIQQGGLAAFLLKPFSYIRMQCMGEIPWRLLNGYFAIIAVFLFSFITHIQLKTIPFSFALLLAIVTVVLGFTIAFFYKMVIGLFAFWIIEIRGLFEALEVVTVILFGNLMPISLLPHWLMNIAYMSPFPYVIYFPVLAFEGKLSALNLFQIISVQIIWISVLFFVYKNLWLRGVKKFSAVGQ